MKMKIRIESAHGEDELKRKREESASESVHGEDEPKRKREDQDGLPESKRRRHVTKPATSASSDEREAAKDVHVTSDGSVSFSGFTKTATEVAERKEGVSLLLSGEFTRVMAEWRLYQGTRTTRSLAAAALVEFGLEEMTLLLRWYASADVNKYIGKGKVFFTGFIEAVVYQRALRWEVQANEDTQGCGFYTLKRYFNKLGYEGPELSDDWFDQQETSSGCSEDLVELLNKVEEEFSVRLGLPQHQLQLLMRLYCCALRSQRNEDVHLFGVYIEDKRSQSQVPKSQKESGERLEKAKHPRLRSFTLTSLKTKYRMFVDIMQNLERLGPFFTENAIALKALGRYWENSILPKLVGETVRRIIACGVVQVGPLQYIATVNEELHFRCLGATLKLLHSNRWEKKAGDGWEPCTFYKDLVL